MFALAPALALVCAALPAAAAPAHPSTTRILAKREFKMEGWVKYDIIGAIVIAALLILGCIFRFACNIVGCGVKGTAGKPAEAFQAALHPPSRPQPQQTYYGDMTGPSQAEIHHMNQMEWDRQQRQNQEWFDQHHR